MRVVLFLCACVCYVAGQNMNDMSNLPKYNTRYDYLDVDAIFYSKRLVRNYVDCLINAQRCTPEGKQLKRILPEALRTKCIRCTERQKKAAVKVIKRLKDEFPEEWAKLASRWDPTGDFTRYFEVYLANEQFNTISGSAGSNEFNGPSTFPPTVPPSPAVRPLPSLPPVPPRSPVDPPSDPTVLPVAPEIPPVVTLSVPVSTPPRPIVVNRFGADGELMIGSPSSAAATPRPTAGRPGISSTTNVPPTTRPTNWIGAGTQANPTRFPLSPTNDIQFTTATTFIDRIGYKIIRTTELFTDILKSTVRAVVGR